MAPISTDGGLRQFFIGLPPPRFAVVALPDTLESTAYFFRVKKSLRHILYIHITFDTVHMLSSARKFSSRESMIFI